MVNKISPGFLLTLAMMLLLMPLRWLSGAIIAAAFHEMCHYITIRLLSHDVTSVRLYSSGARMALPEMSRGRELLCALAGPVGGLLLTLLSPVFPRLAICALIQSVYNLLPIYPLDGGRALACLLAMYLSPPMAAAILRWVTILCKMSLLFVGCYICFSVQWGYLPLILSILICIRTK